MKIGCHNSVAKGSEQAAMGAVKEYAEEMVHLHELRNNVMSRVEQEA